MANLKQVGYFNGYLNKKTGKALGQLKLDSGKSTQAIVEEAINNYLRKPSK